MAARAKNKRKKTKASWDLASAKHIATFALKDFSFDTTGQIFQ